MACAKGGELTDGVPSIMGMAFLSALGVGLVAEDLLWTRVRGQSPVVVSGLIIGLAHGRGVLKNFRVFLMGGNIGRKALPRFLRTTCSTDF